MSETPGNPIYKPGLVSFILVAEFDIDQGSVMKAQYPRPLVSPPPSSFVSQELSYQDLVANMMHPDGSQRQEWDYNYFLLHRPDTPIDKDAMEEWELMDDATSESIDLSTILPETPIDNESTLFAINCITCNRNQQAKRGATVLAVSILSEYPSLSISDGWATGLLPLLRKFLTSALESPDSTTALLKELYLQLNSIECKDSFQTLSTVTDLSFSTKPFFLVCFIDF